MTHLLLLLVRLQATLVVARGRRDERGDVPGWVLVTLMTVGLVGAITAVAQPQLTRMLTNALSKVQ
ncbi:hypothetical protein [Nocardioides sp. zg-DK7169]|uniref:hypothetical protein n=1 Tax=Nocardioides sp. zg-DK7169 TaxID=2736600 RepID=UPI001555E3CD|nr:hypothetical protein [Nocardioides sp. zg-DK7169]NPC97878.1 hypothetical protein [Nocardioides sp. zg-DK7169]